MENYVNNAPPQPEKHTSGGKTAQMFLRVRLNSIFLFFLSKHFTLTYDPVH